MSLEERLRKVEGEVGTMKSLLQKVLDPNGKIDMNLTVEELLVHVTNKLRKTVDVDTSGLPGKVMLCALKDLQQKVFREMDMSKALDERGWHTPHGTLGPQLSKMVASGLLVKEPEGYRPPTHVTFTGDEL